MMFRLRTFTLDGQKDFWWLRSQDVSLFSTYGGTLLATQKRPTRVGFEAVEYDNAFSLITIL